MVGAPGKHPADFRSYRGAHDVHEQQTTRDLTVVRLVALPGRAAGQSEPAPVQWINPEHIVSIRPRMSSGEESVDLIVEVKLEGMPLFETWLGAFRTAQNADDRWQTFLIELADG